MLALISGDEAMARLAALPAAAWLALVPVAWRPGRPPEMLGLAAAEVQAVVDVRLTPQLASWLAARPRLAAWAAQPLHRGLGLAPTPAGGPRWACAGLAARLLAEGGEADTRPAALAAAQRVPPPPDEVHGLEGLGASLTALQATLDGQARALAAAGLADVSRIESAAVAAVAEMESAGMPLDLERWRRATDQLARGWRRAGEALAEATGGGAAPADEAALLGRLRAVGHSLPDLSAASLARLPAPLAALWRERRRLAALSRRFTPAMAGAAAADGRLRAQFDQIGAATGRMACRQPNLQGIPHGLGLRAALRAPPGRLLVTADWRAAELRILTQITGEPHFRRCFDRDGDLHREVARELFSVAELAAVTGQMRRVAKTIVFGLAYGMGEAGLAEALAWPRRRAAALMARFAAAFPRLWAGLAEMEREGQARGVALSLAGRRLRLAHIDAAGRARVARNMPIQGTNADMCKLALAALRRALAALPGAAIVHAVHDEIVVECEAADAEAAAHHLVGAMRAAQGRLLPDVPAAVEVAIGPAWGGDAAD